MDTERIVTYECKVCGRRIDVTRTGDVYEEPIYCCGMETASVGMPAAAAQRPAAKKPVKKAAKKKPAAKKPAKKAAKKKPAAKKPAKKAARKAVKKAAKKKVVKKAVKRKKR